MKVKPKLLDLCCRAGGASVGYASAGFDVTGVDIEPQPDYPYEFHQADAFEFARNHYREFDAIHTSPHCQGYSAMRFRHKKEYPRQIEEFREMLLGFRLPYIIENVEQSPLYDLPLFGNHAITLCGTMFDLRVYRHRIFESNLPLIAPPHPSHLTRCARQGKRPSFDGQFVTVTGNCSDVAYARKAMGINWMKRDDLSQALPPSYTKFIGEQIKRQL